MHDLEVRDNSIETETKFLVVAISVPQMGKGLRYRRGKQLESPSIVPQYRHWKHFVPWKVSDTRILVQSKSANLEPSQNLQGGNSHHLPYDTRAQVALAGHHFNI